MDGTDAPKRDSMGSLPATLSHKPPSHSESSSAPERQPINPEVADSLSELAVRRLGRPGMNDAEAMAVLRLLMEDVSAHLDGEACRAAVKAGVAVWKWLPTCADVIEAAKPFVDHRRDMRRLERERLAAKPEAKPERPLLADNTDADKLLRDTIATLNAGHNKLTGGTLPGAPTARSANLGPPRAPTAAEIAELKAMPSALPVGGASPALKAMLGITTEQAA